MSDFKQIIPNEPVILANAMITPDGNVLQSFSRHDCKAYTDKNGFTYMVDGGLGWYQRTSNDGQAKQIVIDSDDHHSIIREWFSWGSYGNNGKEVKKLIKLKDMELDHINAILDGGHSSIYQFVFENEIEWRNRS